ncbi:MAG: hypothetical protein K9J30_08865 [Bacteroidales bacterium]|nr:hypothetical protein [Bacteroidales bacterium]
MVRRLIFSLLIFVFLDLFTGFFITGDDFQGFRTEHYYYHHGLLPDQSAMAAWGSLLYPFYTNSLGFVDSAQYKVELNTGAERILILGDSHSEGVGVPYLKTFSGRLAQILSEEGIEVLNASCISYSQKIEYLKAKYIIEEQGLNFDHLFVLIDISDMQNELVYEGFDPGKNIIFNKLEIKLKSFLNKRSAIYYLTTAAIKHKRSRKFFETAEVFEGSTADLAETNSMELYSTFFSHFDDNTLLSNPQFHGVSEWYYDDYFRELADRGITLAQEYILQLQTLCSDNNIHLTLSVHPWQTQIMRGDTADYYTEKWRSFCELNGIDFVNLFPLFINEENPVVVNMKFYIRDDNHWNEFGHKKVADFLYGYYSAIIHPDVNR